MASRHDRMALHDRGGIIVMDLGEMDIWDGADLSLLRETLTRLIDVEKHRQIGVEMSTVKYIPSGFFGMLFDWHEKGVEIHLYTPQPNVANMLWFRQFFRHVENGRHILCSEPLHALVPDTPEEWTEDLDWDGEPKPAKVASVRQ